MKAFMVAVSLPGSYFLTRITLPLEIFMLSLLLTRLISPGSQQVFPPLVPFDFI